jgi:hypothetical protein
MLEYIIQNKEIIKLIYGLAIVTICIAIVLKTDRLFRLSYHQGIRYFRNALFFYGISFIFRYFLLQSELFNSTFLSYDLSKFLFEFFIIMAGFFLLYSLLWKNFESEDPYPSSLFNKHLMIFYAMTIVILLLDYIWAGYYFMFISQIALFLAASIVSFNNYSNKGSERKFTKFYFIAMLLSLSAWTLNAVSALYLNWNIFAIIAVYMFNIILFIILLYGVFNVTRKQ